MIWVLFWLLVGVLWRSSYLHSLYLKVCVEGHDTGYNLHGFSCSWLSSCMFGFHLHWIWDWLEILITGLCSCMSCESWHGYSFISFLYWLWRAWKSVGDLLWELFLHFISLYMSCGCPWDSMDSLLWDVVSGLVIDLTLSFAVGASWYICGRYLSWGLWFQVTDWICWWCKIHLAYLWRYG